MAELPSVRRIGIEEVPGAPEWFVQGVLPLINSQFEHYYRTLNLDIDFGLNIRSQVNTHVFETPSDYNAGGSPEVNNFTNIKFAVTMGVRPTGLLIVRIYEDGKIDVPKFTSGVFPSWFEVNNQVEITYVSGLEASKTYIMTTLIF